MKTLIAKLIWKIAGISPEMGNLVMDIAPKLYDFAMWNHEYDEPINKDKGDKA